MIKKLVERISGSKTLNDSEFIEFCYQQILQRVSDAEGKQNFLTQLGDGVSTREQILLCFLQSPEYQGKAESLEFVPPGHFYSAVPSLQDRQRIISNRPALDQDLPDIDINTEGQLQLLSQFAQYYSECPFPQNHEPGSRYYFDNPAYSYTDALTLYSMMRHFSPKRIIEVGSGFSSCAMLDTNDQFFDGVVELTFLEPYPELLISLLTEQDKGQRIIGEKIQDVDLTVFSELACNDILFVDSTHVSKLNSDVNVILFEILPMLQEGVLIHFHDIFWPFEYPNDWLEEGRAWNEAYILRAFLQNNSDYEIMFFANYLHTQHRSMFEENMPLALKNPGGNIWLRKISSNAN